MIIGTLFKIILVSGYGLILFSQLSFAAQHTAERSETKIRNNLTMSKNLSEGPNATAAQGSNSTELNGTVSNQSKVPNKEIPLTVNKSKILRIGVTGDMDCNSAQNKQFDLLNEYNVEIFLSAGDYAYEDGECVLEGLTKRGFTNSNSVIALGNHDRCAELRKWLENSLCFGKETFRNGELDVWMIDSNEKYDSSSSQFSNLSKSMMESNAKHKIVLIHEPFVTAESKHEPNGEFETYHQLFKDSGIDIVIQAHNHNYQRFLIDNVSYYVVGSGTHDKNSKLYNIESKDYKGHPLLKGIDDKNGVAIFDLSTNVTQWFISNSREILDVSVNSPINQTQT